MSTTRKKVVKRDEEATAKAGVPTQISREQWYLIRQVALKRSVKQGRRVTLIELLNEIIESRRPDLEKELRE